MHISEDVVIHITEELDFGFHSPIVLHVLKSRMTVKHSTVPATHFIVADLARILNIVLRQDFGGFFVEFLAHPRWHVPVLRWDNVILALCFCDFLCCLFEGIGKGDIIEKGPGVVEFVVPGSFQLLHGRNEFIEFFVTDEGEESGVDAGWIKAVGFVVVLSVSP